jgi:hypothetical protein
MCESGLENKYRALGQGQTILESSLHTNLAEHLNSEVGLGTIKNMETANEWISHSFLFRRLAQNPHRYMSKEQSWRDGLDSMILKCINDLKDAELLTSLEGRSGELCSTEFGEIMSRVRILNPFARTLQLIRLIVLPQAGYGNKYFSLLHPYAQSHSKMALIMNVPVKATLRDMVRVCPKKRFLVDLAYLHSS